MKKNQHERKEQKRMNRELEERAHYLGAKSLEQCKVWAQLIKKAS